MSSRTKTHRSFRAILAAAAVLVSGAAAEAATLASGPLFLQEQDDYICSAVNTSGRDIDVEVVVTIDGGGSGFTQECEALLPQSVCGSDNEASSPKYRYCTVTTSNKKATRATFCNLTTDVCIPVD